MIKKLGLHHGLITAVVIFVFHWFGWGSNAAYFMAGGYTLMEIRESKWKSGNWSNNPLVIAKNIERMDFIAPCLIVAAYIWWAA